MVELAHVITGLEQGGAELLLRRLLPRLRDAGFASQVVSLTERGAVGAAIAADGFAVRALGMSRRWPSPVAIATLAAWLRHSGARLVQTWLYHGDLIGGLAARLAGIEPVVWGVHTTRLDPAWVRRRTRAVARACALLSHHLPTRILCCSASARRTHEVLGYAADRTLVIENGVDTATFRPDPTARAALRAQLGLAEAVPLIGMAARFHAAKDHAGFLAAAGRLGGNAHFLLCGDGVTPDNRTLARQARAAGVSGRVHLLGPRDDVAHLFAALDLATLSSRSEASPLVLAEAMSCGVPCVATDVGDCSRVIGETGWVVPAGDPAALAAAWRRALTWTAAERAARGAAARRRVEEGYSLDVTAARYADLYRELLG